MPEAKRKGTLQKLLALGCRDLHDVCMAQKQFAAREPPPFGGSYAPELRKRIMDIQVQLLCFAAPVSQRQQGHAAFNDCEGADGESISPTRLSQMRSRLHFRSPDAKPLQALLRDAWSAWHAWQASFGRAMQRLQGLPYSPLDIHAKQWAAEFGAFSAAVRDLEASFGGAMQAASDRAGSLAERIHTLRVIRAMPILLPSWNVQTQ